MTIGNNTYIIIVYNISYKLYRNSVVMEFNINNAISELMGTHSLDDSSLKNLITSEDTSPLGNLTLFEARTAKQP